MAETKADKPAAPKKAAPKKTAAAKAEAVVEAPVESQGSRVVRT